MRYVAGNPEAPQGEYDADIVVLSLGRPMETIAAIRSALAQCGVRIHVTVLDQGSSPSELASIARAIGADQRVTVLAGNRNAGVAAGRNRASAFGHGRIIIGLDSDAIFHTDRSAMRAVGALDAAPDLAAVGFRILGATGESDDALSWGYPRALLTRSETCFEAATFVGAGHAIRRRAWEALGGYDEALFFCWEEMDFARRAIGCGLRVAYRGDIAVRHMVSPDRRIDWSSGRWYYFVRNRLYLERKHGASLFSVALMFLGYMLKGLRNHVLMDGLRGATAALNLMLELRPGPASMLRRSGYPKWAEGAHRPSWWRRIRTDVLSRLPG